MNNSKNILKMSLLFIISFSLFALETPKKSIQVEHKDDHKDEHKDDHKDDHKEEKGKHKDDHNDEKGEHGDDHKEDSHGHGEHKEEASQDGFKLSDAAYKTFDIKLVKYVGAATAIQMSAIYKGLNETNIYRRRNNLFKRIDFKTISKTKDNYFVSSADLVQGDEIVVSGVGFLRMAEIAASGGLESSHSH